jgi:hypothetical protein
MVGKKVLDSMPCKGHTVNNKKIGVIMLNEFIVEKEAYVKASSELSQLKTEQNKAVEAVEADMEGEISRIRSQYRNKSQAVHELYQQKINACSVPAFDRKKEDWIVHYFELIEAGVSSLPGLDELERELRFYEREGHILGVVDTDTVKGFFVAYTTKKPVNKYGICFLGVNVIDTVNLDTIKKDYGIRPALYCEGCRDMAISYKDFPSLKAAMAWFDKNREVIAGDLITAFTVQVEKIEELRQELSANPPLWQWYYRTRVQYFERCFSGYENDERYIHYKNLLSI